MTWYDKNLRQLSLFPEVYVKNNLGSILAKNNLRQLRIAETEKYAHATFFFNSQIETPNKGEDRIMIPSPKCPSYAQKPEMSAYKITEKLINDIKKEKYNFILANFANGDLVGHSGSLKAAIKCCEIVDSCVGIIIKTGLKYNYTILLTSDHGNCEEMLYHDGKPKPSHTLNSVQFTIISRDKKLVHAKLKKGKCLANIAPTILEIMKINKPKYMEESLFY